MKQLLQFLAFLLNSLPKTDWKPLPLCDVYGKYGLTAPNLVGHTSAPTVTTDASPSSITTTSAVYDTNSIDSTGGENPATRGICWVTGAGGTPTTADSHTTENGSFGTGNFSATATGLTTNTTYSVRAYATNSGGTGYGATVEVTTLGVPTVTTQACSSVTATTATGNGNVTSNGGQTITEKGVCYILGTSGTPTTADSKFFDNVNATGAFTESMTGLSSGQHYRVRAYAINASGTSYGTTVQLDLTNTAPTTALNTPADAATGQSTTPTLNFTGTDVDSDTVEYNVQVHTDSTFGGVSVQLSDSYIETGHYDSDWGLLAGTRIGTGQSFIGDGNVLDSAKFYLKKTGAPTGNATVKVYAHSGTYGTSSIPTGTALASSPTLDVSTLTTSSTLITFTFSGANRITLTNGTNYVITFEYNGGDVSNFVSVGRDASSPTHGGNASSQAAAGSWSAFSGTDDIFYLYVEVTILPLLDKLSTTDSGFTAGHPFTSGVAKDFTVQAGDTLANSTTYYWRVRAIDPSGSNTYGSWATTRSFTTTAGGGGTTYYMRNLASLGAGGTITVTI